MSTHNGSDLKYLLEKRGYSLTDVARELGVTTQCISLVIWGRKTSRPVIDHIERLLGMKPGTLRICRNVKRFPRSKAA
jgi:plasmid maintenance system antidote protein VapI